MLRKVGGNRGAVVNHSRAATYLVQELNVGTVVRLSMRALGIPIKTICKGYGRVVVNYCGAASPPPPHLVQKSNVDTVARLSRRALGMNRLTH